MGILSWIILGILVFLALITIVFFYVPIILMKHWERHYKKGDDKLVHSVFSEFLRKERPGREFIKLIQLGFFQCVKTINDSKHFSDDRQYKDFVKYATPEIAQSLRNAGDSLEKYIG
jgi:hypothetical protein